MEMRLSRIGVAVLLVQLQVLLRYSRCCEAQPTFEPEWNKGALSLKFYDKTCPQVEAVVSTVFTQFVQSDRTLMGSLLRMAYHDCFVQVWVDSIHEL